MKTLFVTNPHGAIALRQTESGKELSISSRLFTLFDTSYPVKSPGEEPFQITLTGEEMDSLCAKWARFRKKES